MGRRLCRLIGCVAWISAAAGAPLLWSADVDTSRKDQIVASLSDRLKKIHSFYAIYRLDETFSPMEGPEIEKLRAQIRARNPGRRIVTKRGLESRECEMYFLNGKVRYEERLSGATLAKAGGGQIAHEIAVHTSTRTERFYSTRNGTLTGGIESPQPLPFSAIEFGLGLRAEGENDFLTRRDLDQCDVYEVAEGRIELRRDEPAKKRRHVWTYDLAPSVRLVSYDVIDSIPGIPVDAIKVSAGDFRDVAGLSLPFTVIAGRFNNVRPEKPVKEERASVVEYQLGGVKDTPEIFMITYPLGTNVLDSRINKAMVVKSRPRTLSDEDIIKAVGLPIERDQGSWAKTFTWMGMAVLFVGVPLALFLRRRMAAS